MSEHRSAGVTARRDGGRRIVVVGGGMVAQRFAEAAVERELGHVTLVTEEPHPPYDRVALSSYLEDRTAADLHLAHDGWWDAPRRRLLTERQVMRVDRAGRRVRLSSGGWVGYDALVLATGSYPFVPPVPGSDLAGCFVYRTLDDLDAIREYAGRGMTTGAVIGGGLLGLEAARALQGLGLRTTVVEAAPRLMTVQLDEAGAGMLRRQIEAMGIDVVVGSAPTSVVERPGGRAGALTFADGPDVAADVVVIAAGIRPRDELARSCGLPVGERGGVVVDEGCRTEDPHVWAIGEVACVDGRCYGLVAPGYAQAEVVADRLAGGTASVPEADTSTKLKLLGVDVASFGDAHAATPGALELVWADWVAGVYKKLVVTDDARVLLGGILVGDASTYSTLRPLVGCELPAEPQALVAPAGLPAVGAEALPGTAVICSCHNVSKERICTVVRDEGRHDVAGIKECTKAGTGCGSCVPLLTSLLRSELRAQGIEVSRALCEHFDLSRAELFDVVRVNSLRTFSEVVERHGRGRGCDICKPAVASILASLGSGHILDGEQATLQDTNDHFLANLQRNGTYSVVPRVPGGEVTPEQLIVLGEVARDFGLYTKITGGQRIDLFGARVEQLPAIWKRLVDAGFESGHAYGKALRTVKSCVGETWCRYGVQDSVGLAVALELRYRGLRAPHKLKSAVSGCARECAEAQSKDFGVIATEHGWNLYVCGNGGMRPRHADLLVQDVDTETLIRYIDRFLMFYIRTADRLQRTSVWLENLEGGIERLRSVVVDDALGVAADLEAQMATHVASYADEWKATLEDPDRLRRFVSFVNAPDVPDPSIAFVSERGQIRPAPQLIAPAVLAVVGASGPDGAAP